MTTTKTETMLQNIVSEHGLDLFDLIDWEVEELIYYKSIDFLGVEPTQQQIEAHYARLQQLAAPLL